VECKTTRCGDRTYAKETRDTALAELTNAEFCKKHPKSVVGTHKTERVDRQFLCSLLSKNDARTFRPLHDTFFIVANVESSPDRGQINY
jgi:hypothetical protein